MPKTKNEAQLARDALALPEGDSLLVGPCDVEDLLERALRERLAPTVTMLDPWYNKGVGGTRPDYHAYVLRLLALAGRVSPHVFLWGFPEIVAPLVERIPAPLTLNAWLTWFYKNNPSVIRGWRSAQMTCLHLVREDAVMHPEHFLNEAQLAKKAAGKLRYMPGPTSVLEVALLIGFIGKKEQTGHPSQKPAAVYEPLYKMATVAGDLVLDPMAGSGTTGAVAKTLGLRAVLGDASPEYVGMIEKRLGVRRRALGRLATGDRHPRSACSPPRAPSARPFSATRRLAPRLRSAGRRSPAMIARLALSFSVVATLLTACAHGSDLDPSESAGDAVAGAHADAHDAAVVALRSDGFPLCTGVLVGPRLVLSSRGCVTGVHARDCPHPAPIGAPPQMPAIERDPSTIEVLTGEDVATAHPVARGFHVTYPAGVRACEADVALLELDQSITGATPLAVALAAITGGEKMRVVGFGVRKANGAPGRKASKAGLAVGAVSTTQFTIPTSACEGDEGGPAIDEHTGRVVGVVSRALGTCGAPDALAVFTRNDAFPALLQPVIDGAKGSAGAGGGGGASGQACSSAHHCPKHHHCNKTTGLCEAVP